MILIVLIAAAVFFLRGVLPKMVFMRKGDKLAEKIPPEFVEYYSDELRYTLDRFWACYEEGIVSKNDLNDVVERLDALNRKDDVTKSEIFQYIGYVSGLYSEAITERDARISREKEAERLSSDSVRVRILHHQ